ncbi:MAG: hypothetical protein ACYC1C_03855 [Chloroflexota bacterium]
MAGWIPEVPGFGPHASRRDVLAALGYLAIAVLLIVGITGQPGALLLGLYGLGVALLARNSWGLRARLPLLGTASKAKLALGWLATAAIGAATVATATPQAPLWVLDTVSVVATPSKLMLAQLSPTALPTPLLADLPELPSPTAAPFAPMPTPTPSATAAIPTPMATSTPSPVASPPPPTMTPALPTATPAPERSLAMAGIGAAVGQPLVSMATPTLTPTLTPTPTPTQVPPAAMPMPAQPTPTPTTAPVVPTQKPNLPKPTETSVPPTPIPPSPTPTATPAGPEITRLTLDIVSVTSPVKVGTEATLQAKTVPGAECLITVFYKPGERIRPHLEAKTADDAGNVSWTWQVGSGPGTWPVWVTARSHGQIEIEKTTYTVENDGQDGNAEPNDGKSSAPSPTATAVATMTPASKPNDDARGTPSAGQSGNDKGEDRAANPNDSQNGGKNESQSSNSDANKSAGDEGKNGDSQSGDPNDKKDNTNQSTSTNEGSKNANANSSKNDDKSSNDDGKNAKK